MKKKIKFVQTHGFNIKEHEETKAVQFKTDITNQTTKKKHTQPKQNMIKRNFLHSFI